MFPKTMELIENKLNYMIEKRQMTIKSLLEFYKMTTINQKKKEQDLNIC